MASHKRLRYSEGTTDGSNSDTDSDSSLNSLQQANDSRRNYITRKPKSLSRNALMARENRLKKKIYMANLEKELIRERNKGKKMNAMVKEQANIIEKQEREIRYMKNILANNTDISRLLRSIHTNTGMCVGTSLNPEFTKIRTEQKSHPWQPDEDLDSLLPLNDDLSPSIDELPMIDELFPPNLLPKPSLDDHNYTLSSEQDDVDNVGVCLHISNHKVALEFCANCNENANHVWLRSNALEV